jgi:hypothetical protein
MQMLELSQHRCAGRYASDLSVLKADGDIALHKVRLIVAVAAAFQQTG